MAITEWVKNAARSSVVLGGLTLLAAQSGAQSGTKCNVFGNPQVSSTLISLQNRSTRSVYRKGEQIRVKLTLRAGDQGAYLPDFFGPFMETCSHGFDSEVLTVDGQTADPRARGCAYAGGPPKVAFLKLNPGETRTWNTMIETKFITTGRYCLYAEYLTSAQLLDTAVGLPEDKALVAAGRITARPVPIEIR